MSKKYRLISEDLPVLEVGISSSEYDGLLDDFIKGKAGTVRIDFPSKSTKALISALRSRITKRNLRLKAAERNGNVYLTKT